jgi:predicted SnoaL-like aldol condensation-catalyzing enzyme
LLDKTENRTLHKSDQTILDLYFSHKNFIPHGKDTVLRPKTTEILRCKSDRSSQIVYYHTNGKLECHTKQTGLVQNVVQAAKTVDEQNRPVRNTLNRLFKEEISTSEQRFWYTEL